MAVGGAPSVANAGAVAAARAAEGVNGMAAVQIASGTGGRGSGWGGSGSQGGCCGGSATVVVIGDGEGVAAGDVHEAVVLGVFTGNDAGPCPQVTEIAARTAAHAAEGRFKNSAGKRCGRIGHGHWQHGVLVHGRRGGGGAAADGVGDSEGVESWLVHLRHQSSLPGDYRKGGFPLVADGIFGRAARPI